MKLLFATQNENKIKEIAKILPNHINLMGLKDLGFNDDIPETSPTLEGNALLKAQFLAEKFKLPVFADDTGLEIEALGGAPGVLSARYAGEDKNAEKNMALVLEKLKDHNNRNAQFRTVIAYIHEGKEYLFEGKVLGSIRDEKCGEDGFGYDPIFQPEGYQKTFAEITLEEKNKISHRGLAVQKLIDFLKK
ncbi:MAG: non-canonical purine NTP diphosphatase [Flavobacteriales bacterium]|jgi:XTP/dITP diphosphohydrolase|nr:non-canonical purine NTP diphosphatase [Flavobacteriales bacterium]